MLRLTACYVPDTSESRPADRQRLAGRNSLSEAMLDSILRACGVRGQDRQAWLDDWFRLGLVRQMNAPERQLEGYRQRTGRRAWQ
jgi:hypothetical protein